jgi:hypothetical protein
VAEDQRGALAGQANFVLWRLQDVSVDRAQERPLASCSSSSPISTMRRPVSFHPAQPEIDYLNATLAEWLGGIAEPDGGCARDVLGNRA